MVVALKVHTYIVKAEAIEQWQKHADEEKAIKYDQAAVQVR